MNPQRPAAELIALPRSGKPCRRPQRRAFRVLQHATEATHLFDGPQGQLLLALPRLRELTKTAPRAARRMGNHRQAAGPAQGITLGIPYIAAGQRLVIAV